MFKKGVSGRVQYRIYPCAAKHGTERDDGHYNTKRLLMRQAGRKIRKQANNETGVKRLTAGKVDYSKFIDPRYALRTVYQTIHISASLLSLASLI